MTTSLIALLMLLVISVQAQEKKEEQQQSPKTILANNEVKLKTLYLLSYETIEASYERLINDESAMGISLGLGFDKQTLIPKYGFSILPYYRLYFGKKKRAAGFFVEGYGALYSQEARPADILNRGGERLASSVGFSLGVAIGGKFITYDDWIIEIIYGIGRNFVNTDKIDQIHWRIGLLFGKRF